MSGEVIPTKKDQKAAAEICNFLYDVQHPWKCRHCNAIATPEYCRECNSGRKKAIAQILAKHRCLPGYADRGFMESAIRWTRYDGTPETLPDRNHCQVLFFRKSDTQGTYFYHKYGEHIEFLSAGEQIIPNNGDLWAYLPVLPEGMG